MNKKVKKENLSNRDRFIKEYDAKAQVLSDMISFKKGQREALTPEVYDIKKKELEAYINNNKPLYEVALKAKQAQAKYIEYSEKLDTSRKANDINDIFSASKPISDNTIQQLEKKQKNYQKELQQYNGQFNDLYKKMTKPVWDKTPNEKAVQSTIKVGTHLAQQEIKSLSSTLSQTTTLRGSDVSNMFIRLRELSQSSSESIKHFVNAMDSAFRETNLNVSSNPQKQERLLSQFKEAAKGIVEKLTKRPPTEITTAIPKAKEAADATKTESNRLEKPKDISPRGSQG